MVLLIPPQSYTISPTGDVLRLIFCLLLVEVVNGRHGSDSLRTVSVVGEVPLRVCVGVGADVRLSSGGEPEDADVDTQPLSVIFDSAVNRFLSASCRSCLWWAWQRLCE